MQVSEEVAPGVLLWNASLVLKKYLEEKARSELGGGANVLELGTYCADTLRLARSCKNALSQ